MLKVLILHSYDVLYFNNDTFYAPIKMYFDNKTYFKDAIYNET